MGSNNNANKKMKMKNLSSFIWKHCIEVEGGWKCNICGEIFNYGKTSGSTTNTLRHLEREHGLIRPEISAKVFFI